MNTWSEWWAAAPRIERGSWVVGNIKGGAGKTTTAVFLALALARGSGRSVALIDADPSRQAWLWSRLPGAEWPQNLAVLESGPSHLETELSACIRDHDYVIVDTEKGDQQSLRAACKHVSRLIVPFAPTWLEMQQMQPTLDVVSDIAQEREDLGLSILLTRTVTNGNARHEVRRELQKLDYPVMTPEIPFRVSYGEALDVETVSQLGRYGPVADELTRKDD